MLRIVDKTEEKSVYIPVNSGKICESYLFNIYSEITKKMETIEVQPEIYYQYFKIGNLDFSDFEDGEYHWSLKGDGEILSTGMILIGSLPHARTAYNKKQEYKQYEG